MLLIFRFTALLLITLLLPLPVLPQNASGLRMRPLNESLDSKSMRVEVTDAQGQAVPDATVTFRLPEDGSGGTFSTGARVAVVNTNQNGQATVNGIRWSRTGAASVRVTASKGTAHAGILIDRQTTINREPEVLTKEPAALPKMVVTSAPKPATVTPVQIAIDHEPAVLPQAPADGPKSAVPTTSKPAVAIVRSPATQPALPEPKPTVPVAAAVKLPAQKAVVPAAAAPQTTAAVTPTTLTPMPTIEPPHVSITSVSGKQLDRAQLSQNSNAAPNVVITGAGHRSHSGSKKWVILAVIAAGAAGGAAFMLSRGKSSSAASTTSSTGVSIGAPTISIGAP